MCSGGCGGLEPTLAGEALDAEGGAAAGAAGGDPPGGDACASSYSAPPTPFIMVHQAGPAEWPEAGAGDAAAASQGAPSPPTWLSGYRVAAGQATGDRESRGRFTRVAGTLHRDSTRPTRRSGT